MRPIDEIILKTQRLKDLLAQVPEEPTYDTWMDQIHELLDDREQLLSAHGPDLKAADQTVIRQLVDDSQKIARLIEAEHQRLGMTLGTTRQERKTVKSYVDPYEDVDSNFSGLFDQQT
ncbi:flagellar protein FliT [Exiguobacterium sp. SH3S2]|uniref:flagellar protein FliT n=1 Tax=unclassified Exiguobacterium TaxID=2644629 RepID=UPI00103FC4C8|nr:MULTISPECIES: flagellar protein FliT [unclassified Exiguobacterium]TCI41546.1 flagellar protein FliT [Exiguobacterium sp. SH3S3]TCI58184.1 flagellar protein FliT [Exiguobacterium sp. SH3S2]